MTDVGFAFLNELCRERGLGVAQNLATSNADEASRRAVSLVQSIPDYLSRCRTRDEAFAVVHLVVDILTSPTEAEAMFWAFSVRPPSASTLSALQRRLPRLIST